MILKCNNPNIWATKQEKQAHYSEFPRQCPIFIGVIPIFFYYSALRKTLFSPQQQDGNVI